jgi:hypothetical protein
MNESKKSGSSYAIHTGYGLVGRSARAAGLREFCAGATPYTIASIAIALIIFYMLV